MDLEVIILSEVVRQRKRNIHIYIYTHTSYIYTCIYLCMYIYTHLIYIYIYVRNSVTEGKKKTWFSKGKGGRRIHLEFETKNIHTTIYKNKQQEPTV